MENVGWVLGSVSFVKLVLVLVVEIALRLSESVCLVDENARRRFNVVEMLKLCVVALIIGRYWDSKVRVFGLFLVCCCRFRKVSLNESARHWLFSRCLLSEREVGVNEIALRRVFCRYFLS